MTNGEPWVLSLVVDGSDPAWDERVILIGTKDWFEQRFDLSNLPPGAILLRGEKAEQFLRQSLHDEARYQRERKPNGQPWESPEEEER